MTDESPSRDSIWRLPFDYQAALAEGYEGDEVEAYTVMGTFLVERGDREGAITAFRQAIAIDSARSTPHYHLGIALMSWGRYEKAAEALTRAAELNPDHWVGQYKLGQSLLRAGKPEESLAAFTQAHALNPRSPSPLVHRSEAHSALEDFKQARLDLEAALQIEPNAQTLRKRLEALDADEPI